MKGAAGIKRKAAEEVSDRGPRYVRMSQRLAETESIRDHGQGDVVMIGLDVGSCLSRIYCCGFLASPYLQSSWSSA